MTKKMDKKQFDLTAINAKKIIKGVHKLTIEPFLAGVLGALISSVELLGLKGFGNKYRTKFAGKSSKELLLEEKQEKGQLGFLISQIFLWTGFFIVMLITIPSIAIFILLKGVSKGLARTFSLQQMLRNKLSQIDEMSGYDFELFLKTLFSIDGFSVKITKRSGDQGADLIMSKGGIKTIVQAKCHKQKIGNKAIQEATAAIRYYKCDKAMVVTNSVFTKSAIDLADANFIELVDKNKLRGLVYKTLERQTHETKKEMVYAMRRGD